MVRNTRRRIPAAMFLVGGLLLLRSPLLVADEPQADEAPPVDAPPETSEPWDLAGPPRPFVSSCFDHDWGELGGLTQADATQWLRAADGHELKITETKSDYGCAVTLRGVARLRAPWLADSVLRLSVDSSQTFELHFWARTEGIILQSYGSGTQQLWAAYRTTRPPSGKLTIGGEMHRAGDPGLALLTTDGRRGARTYSGTFEIRHQQDSLVMTHGDVRLLTVPLDSPPTVVHLKGDGLLLRQLAMFQGEAVPEAPRRDRPHIIRSDRPARLRWRERTSPSAELQQHHDGPARLVAKDSEQVAWACVPLLRADLCEVIIELDEPAPGTGVYLGHGDGPPAQGIGFFRDPRTGLTFLGYDEPADAAPATSVNRNQAPAPFVGRRHWLRLVLANGNLKCWTSGDGIHWGQALPPLTNVPGGCSHVGLYCRPGPGRRSIGLRRLYVRRLDTLTSLAPTALRERAEKVCSLLLPEAGIDEAAWRQRVWELQPTGVEPAAWRRACALATLTGTCPSTLGNRLIDGLLDDALSLPGRTHSHGALLSDAALLYDAWSAADATRFVEHVRRGGRHLLDTDKAAGYREVRRQLLELPVWTETQRVDPIPTELAGEELLSLVGRQAWRQAHTVCQELRFFHETAKPAKNKLSGQPQLNKWVTWADGLASPRLTRRAGSAAAISADWRHPFIVQLDKEAYNLHAELMAALREEDYRSASQILISGAAGHDWGLIVDPEDERLVTSLPTACLLLMRRHPPLSASMRSELDRADLTRLRRAMVQSDVPAVQAATIRYFGTPVAAEANGWLGDRLFAEGRIARAVSAYHQALASASDDYRPQLAARVRLAQAMLGVDAGEPVTETVTFGQVDVTPSEFERLVAEMRETHAADVVATQGTTVGRLPPEAAAWEVRFWSKLDRVNGPDLSALSAAARPADWCARRVATALAGDWLLVTDRYRVVAYDQAAGTVKWSYSPGETPAQDALWSMVSMRPRVFGDRVFVRLLTGEGQPELVCLERDTGKLVWNSGPAGVVVSDPVWMHEELMAITLDPSARSITSRLMLTFFSPDTGAVLSEKPLLEYRGLTGPLQSWEVTVVDDNIVGAGVGTVFCCDTLGQLRWVRREPWIPPSLDPGFARQRYARPLVAGDRVFATQPGMRSVICLELASGRLFWRRSILDLQRLVGLDQESLVIATDRGLCTLHAGSGTQVWSHPVAELLDCYARIGEAGLLFLQNDTVTAEESCPVLVWLDPATGHTRGTCALGDVIGKRPVVGPLFAAGDRLWCFAGVFDEQGKLKPETDILELVAGGPPIPHDNGAARSWAPAGSDHLQAAASILLPGWRILSAPQDKDTGLRTELAGKQRVVVTKADATPTRFAQQVPIPETGKPRLMLEFGHAPDSKSKLQIRVAGIPIQQAAPDPTTTADQWQQMEIDLSQWAGRDLWITITQERIGSAAAYMYWKRAEVVP